MRHFWELAGMFRTVHCVLGMVHTVFRTLRIAGPSRDISKRLLREDSTFQSEGKFDHKDHKASVLSEGRMGHGQSIAPFERKKENRERDLKHHLKIKNAFGIHQKASRIRSIFMELRSWKLGTP